MSDNDFDVGLLAAADSLGQDNFELLQENESLRQQLEAANKTIEALRNKLKKSHKEMREVVQSAAAEENWRHVQGDDYGSY